MNGTFGNTLFVPSRGTAFNGILNRVRNTDPRVRAEPEILFLIRTGGGGKRLQAQTDPLFFWRWGELISFENAVSSDRGKTKGHAQILKIHHIIPG